MMHTRPVHPAGQSGALRALVALTLLASSLAVPTGAHAGFSDICIWMLGRFSAEKAESVRIGRDLKRAYRAIEAGSLYDVEVALKRVPREAVAQSSLVYYALARHTAQSQASALPLIFSVLDAGGKLRDASSSFTLDQLRARSAETRQLVDHILAAERGDAFAAARLDALRRKRDPLIASALLAIDQANAYELTHAIDQGVLTRWEACDLVHRAVDAKQFDLARLLIDRGAPIWAPNQALEQVIYQQRHARLNAALDARDARDLEQFLGGDFEGLTPERGNWLLQRAFEARRDSAVYALIDRSKLKVDGPFEIGWSAIRAKNAAAVEELLRRKFYPARVGENRFAGRKHNNPIVAAYQNDLARAGAVLKLLDDDFDGYQRGDSVYYDDDDEIFAPEALVEANYLQATNGWLSREAQARLKAAIDAARREAQAIAKADEEAERKRREAIEAARKQRARRNAYGSGFASSTSDTSTVDTSTVMSLYNIASGGGIDGNIVTPW